MLYEVKCLTASGREMTVKCYGRNGDDACKQALAHLNTIEPDQGWQAQWALPQ